MKNIIVTADMALKFWRKVNKTSTCWLWMGGRTPKGYGAFYLGRRNGRKVYQPAHQVAIELTEGQPLKKGICGLHKCDNPPCVRPHSDHVFKGTKIDNAADRDSKGRQSRGEKVNTAKLTELQVREIRRRYGPAVGKGYSGQERQADLAREFCIRQDTLSAIVRRKTWKHLP